MHQHQQQQQQRLRRELEAEIPLPTSRRSGHGSDHADSEAFFLEEQGRQHERGRQSSSSSSSDPEFPDPWQGKFDLPQNDEEIVNTAQVWVMGCCFYHRRRSHAVHKMFFFQVCVYRDAHENTVVTLSTTWVL